MLPTRTDLATQMRYLTDVSSSQCSSKVISWISESGEIFDLEGTGQLYTSAREISERDGCKTLFNSSIIYRIAGNFRWC